MSLPATTRAVRTLVIVAGLGVAASASVGCASSRGAGPYASMGEERRDSERSRRLVAQATKAVSEDDAEAERLLREALTFDLYNGPAHNDLGILLLKRGDLYGAAGEFEWARKLMPGHPAPRVNLAMTLERAGKTDDALEAYDAALAVYDNFLPALQGKARLEVVSGRADRDTSPRSRRSPSAATRRGAAGLSCGSPSSPAGG